MDPVDLTEKLERLPDRRRLPLQGRQGAVVYVGKAASLRARVRSYFQASRTRDAKTDALVDHIADLDYIVTANELEALILESNLVKRHRPRYNIILRDDKHYPFLKLTTNEEYPRLLVARRVQKDGATYYGPFYPQPPFAETLRLVRALFPSGPAASRSTGRRSGRASSTTSTGARPRAQGGRRARATRDREGRGGVPRGKGRGARAAPDRRDGGGAAQEKYERAGILRDQVQALNTVRERQKIISVEPEDQDILGLARQGSEACVQIFFVRRGRCSAARRSSWTSSAAPRRRAPLGAPPQFYSKSVVPAREVLLSIEVPEEALLAEWLFQLREGKVDLLVPSAGGSGSSSRWPRRTRPSPFRPTSWPGRAVARSWPRSFGESSVSRNRRTGSRDSTSRTSRAGSRRLHGRVGRRRDEEGRLQALQDPHRARGGRLRHDG
jgi:excinuclease ABC subunit C